MSKREGAGRRAWETRRRNIIKKGGPEAAKVLKKLGLSDWHAAEGSGMLAKKDPERQRVGDFLLKHHPLTARPHFLTLPGSQWLLEWRLYEALPNAIFTGLERDRKFVKAVRVVHDECAPGGKLTEMVRGDLRNDVSRLLIGPAGELGNRSYLRLGTKNEGAGPGVPVTGYEAIPVTGGWFDGMGTLTSRDFADFVAALPKHISKTHPVPFVFTLLKGRENGAKLKGIHGNVLSKRVRYLIRLCRQSGLEFHIRDFWSYKSDMSGDGKGMQMMNICGLLTLKLPAGFGHLNAPSWDLFSHYAYTKLIGEHGIEQVASWCGVSEHTARAWLLHRRTPDAVAQIELAKLAGK